jgi:hypothetical protein
MKVAVATISFGNKDDRRTIHWYGQEGEVGQLYLENECLGEEFDCQFGDVRSAAKRAYPEKVWDLEFLDSFLVF